jgi:mono/diheme cytochrome c family protein
MLRSCCLLVLALLTSAVFVSCNSYTPKQTSTNDGNAAASGGQPGYTVPTYAYTFAQVFQPYCISCHSSAGGNSGGVNLETYSNTIQNLTNINSAVLVTQIMPPSHPIPALAQNILKEWINGGAPLNGVTGPPSGGSPTPTPTPPPGPQPSPTPPVAIQPTYTSLAQNIFTPKCISCHSAGGSQSNRPLDSYQAIINGGYVQSGNPSGSTLYQVISSGKMPPGNPLNQAAVQALSAWITNGAKNN